MTDAEPGAAAGATAPDTAVARYLTNARALLDDIATRQAANIEQAAEWVADTIARDGLVYVAGSGHSHLLAEEVFYRAGGLAAIVPLLEQPLMLHDGAIKSTAYERLEGLAEIIVSDAGLTEADLLIVASNSGRNAYPVELVLAARRRGCRTIGLTSLATAGRVEPRHSSGKLLSDLSDLVLDNCVPYGDASVEIAGHPAHVGPLSTIAGAAILNATMARAVEVLVGRGLAPDTFVSANVQESDRAAAPDLARWRRRIRRL